MAIEYPKKNQITRQSVNEWPLPEKWSINDVSQITGLEVVDVKVFKHSIACTLRSGVNFRIKKW